MILYFLLGLILGTLISNPLYILIAHLIENIKHEIVWRKYQKELPALKEKSRYFGSPDRQKNAEGRVAVAERLKHTDTGRTLYKLE